MTDAGGRRGGPAAERSPVALLQRRIMEQLASSEQVVQVLRGQLAASRQRTDELVRERNELLKVAARTDLALEVPAAPADPPAVAGAAAEVAALRRENAELQRRCVELEQAVAEQRRARSLAQEEITCLEEQVAQLQATVDLICEHLELEEPPAAAEPD